MKLKDFDFNKLKILAPLRFGSVAPIALCVKEEDGTIENGNIYETESIQTTLLMLPAEWANREVKSTFWYFNEFVIIVEKEK